MYLWLTLHMISSGDLESFYMSRSVVVFVNYRNIHRLVVAFAWMIFVGFPTYPFQEGLSAIVCICHVVGFYKKPPSAWPTFRCFYSEARAIGLVHLVVLLQHLHVRLHFDRQMGLLVDRSDALILLWIDGIGSLSL